MVKSSQNPRHNLRDISPPTAATLNAKSWLTEAVLGGSDAVSDWPLLNAFVNTASRATGIRLRHGGGVSPHSGVVSGVMMVADGMPDTAKRLKRVVWNDPASGVYRHANAGYNIAVDHAKTAGLRLPAILGS